jgi:methionine-rich copper-binding protein CopC
MSKQKLILNCIGVGVLAAVMMGCTTPAPTQASTAPTVDFEKTIEVVKTQSAGTAVANITPVVCALTSTPLPTATNTLTPTTAPTATITNTLMPWWTKTPTQASGGCTVTESSPPASEVFGPNTSFDGKWVIKNTDIRYATGTKMQTKADVLDMKNDVAEGDTYTVIVDMKAPAAAGTYTTTWVVYTGGQIICSMPLRIVVQ